MSRDEQDDANVVNGFGVAATMVHVLTQCGADLSRKNIMSQPARPGGQESTYATLRDTHRPARDLGGALSPPPTGIVLPRN